jgi:glutathione S-transferase
MNVKGLTESQNQEELLRRAKRLCDWAYEGVEIGQALHQVAEKQAKESALRSAMIAAVAISGSLGAALVAETLTQNWWLFGVQVTITLASAAATLYFFWPRRTSVDSGDEKTSEGKRPIREVYNSMESIHALHYQALMGLVEAQILAALLKPAKTEDD